MAAHLPLAAGLDWIEGILPFLFVLFWIVSQVRTLFRAGDAVKPRPPVVPRRGPAAPPGGDDVHQELARQIEEFLRRSSDERSSVPQAGPQRVAPTPAGSRREAPAPGRRSSPPPPIERSVQRRPQRAASAARPASAVGSLGGHATDVSRHVRDAFAHELEHLPSGLASAPAAADALATAVQPRTTAIAQMLRDPATLRQLVIVREVLERPVDRW